ncbi:unnamed protein product [Arctia plantaginis]|uniref:DNA oxidative demethylase ALKBH2 n=1 Tax=Arctia plantaginis TaxID=874455 RepID=A0A8S0ZNS8_ARCPL|nr:unnamed protein product [Arctia plantaginis]
MYIAFKWLLGLTFVMWVAMCSIDILIKKSKDITDGDFQMRPLVHFNIKNSTIPQKNKLNFHRQTPLSFIHRMRDKQIGMMYLHGVMFLAGALVVSCYKRMTKLYSVTKRELATIFTSANGKKIQEYSKIAVAEVNRISILMYEIAWEHLKDTVRKSINASRDMMFKLIQKPRVNHLLLKKIKELCEERKNLAQLLIAAIHENKNIRMQYQLESMAKNRLVRHIETTQKVIKENRTRYVSFQQLYLVTHQENVFLKSRIKKLTQEKEEASTNLLELVNEVYKSKNNDLRAYCSRFIVKSKDNLLNSDVGAEINTFLNRKSQMAKAKTSCCRLSDVTAHDLNSESRSCSSCTQISDTCMLPFCTEAPKLKGLPGEYVWTVKDKDGLIEKLYEYDCEPDFDNGDTIRRIREYSVYFDKDCLLDFSNSTTVVNDTTTCSGTFVSKATVDFPLARQKFLTGSEAFQRSRTYYKYLLKKIGMEKLKEINSVIEWKNIKQEDLDLEYSVVIPKNIANKLFQELEETLEYFTGDLSKIKVFGKEYPLPRQQVAYGAPGITYKYSGLTVPALPWPDPVLALREFLFSLKGIKYDFVLVNKYRNGHDHMGEHRDNEPELDPNYPIASVSLGQERTFVLKHRDTRKPGKDKKLIPPGKNLF